MENEEYDLFSFFDTVQKQQSGSLQTGDLLRSVTPGRMRQAVTGFLAGRRPDGIAVNVPVRFRKYQVAAAAFWFEDTGRIHRVAHTAAVEIYDRRDRCFADCANCEALLAEIHSLRKERSQMEALIRTEEPELADRDDLFDDMRTWHYEKSMNHDYRKLLRQMDKLQHNLYHGSRLDIIRRAGVADELFLAVPEGVLEPDERPAGWGLLIIHPGGSVSVAAEAEEQQCRAELRNHLALNIARAAASNVLFAAGVETDDNGAVKYYRPPRRRRRIIQG